jgi:PAS domain S-box-containing protein
VRSVQELHLLLVESIVDYAVFALDPTGHIVSWNAGAERIKGYMATEIIGQHFSVFYPPEDIASRKPDRELVLAAAHGRFEDEGWRLRKDGTPFWANVIITALRDPSGQLIGYGKVTRDLTDRRRAEEALRLSEERFRLMVENARDYGIFMLDTSGCIVSWNEGAHRIKGYTAQEIIGRHVSVFYPAEEIAEGKVQRELQIAAAEGRFEDEGWRVRKDGSFFWASVIITSLRDDNGDLIGFAKVTRDLTERRAAHQRALADARRVAEIEAASRAKSEFLAAMSHELRTPLNAIGGYVDLIIAGLRGPVTDDQRRDLERIRHSQKHLLGIINDLLNFSRIEAGRLTYDIRPVALHQVIDAVMPMIAPQALSKGLAFDRGQCAKQVMARADRVKLEQILLNLLSNAVKFTPPGGSITVTCGASGDRVQVNVADTGPGIPTDKLEAIFEPFVQLGRTWSTVQEGTGLGLSISRDLARAMQGDLTVASTPGQGSVFSVVLPAVT